MTDGAPIDDLPINANPTKRFFIEMLTKDIQLQPAIIDLLDNCLDGARRLRQNGPYDGLFAEIEVLPDRFRIRDNCGGISIERAKKYAFRFGRVEDPNEVHGTIGQFGVGMKRALFKLGESFSIESTTTGSRFKLDFSIEEWTGRDPWGFKFASEDPTASVAEAETGTTIEVTKLHPGVVKDFELPSFVGSLATEIGSREGVGIQHGFRITVNGVEVEAEPEVLLISDTLKPIVTSTPFNGGRPEVLVELYAGVSTPEPTDAGWYVYCNGREILRADKSTATGWGAGRGYPKFHYQYDRFRGYVFFTSEDGTRLPWTTTKTSVDEGAEVYRFTRLSMLSALAGVKGFLDSVDREIELPDDYKVLAKTLKDAKAVSIFDLPRGNPTFQYPPPHEEPAGDPMVGITFHRPESQVEAVKKVAKVGSAKGAGEAAFDYFFRVKARG